LALQAAELATGAWALRRVNLAVVGAELLLRVAR
jgi:hypothetical protein